LLHWFNQQIILQRLRLLDYLFWRYNLMEKELWSELAKMFFDENGWVEI
jgi:hypothetical protein